MNVQIPNTFYRISVKALIQNFEGKVLLVKESNGTWELPGGGLDHGEEPAICIKRELHEEMGLTVVKVAEHPSYFLTWQEDEKWKSNLVYETQVQNLKFKPSEECVELGFFNKSEAEKLKVFPNVKKFFELYKSQ